MNMFILQCVYVMDINVIFIIQCVYVMDIYALIVVIVIIYSKNTDNAFFLNIDFK
jgi:hypothetical protein